MDCVFTVGIVGVEDVLFCVSSSFYCLFSCTALLFDLLFFTSSFLAAGVSREGLLRLDRSVK